MSSKPAIAVVAMSGVFPGAVGIQNFWHNIVHEVSAIVDIPNDRTGSVFKHIYNPSFEIDKTYSKKAALVFAQPDMPDGFAGSQDFFSSLDPLHQWSLYSACDAFSNSKVDGYPAQRRGLVLASIALPTGFSASLSEKLFNFEIRKSYIFFK